ncbi:MAG TPA: D-alanyl-D-alanine carboxypeptidase/D-alanyl-D-alanine-endopeptidase [Anaerohalosphaeraceae bacterium]|nr:D-alanyl-D-alanine carboxypeptidase/D-alanyl-D-alanine-endopeptidase [Anaerohalosphaeraceae bacterium]
MFSRKYFNIGLLLCCWTVPLCAASKPIDEVLRDSAQKKTRYSVLVMNASDGKTIFARNPDTQLMPASNMKLITTAAAVHYLGADYVFKTEVGLLDGSLVIVGGGDPLLGDLTTDTRYSRKAGWVMDTIAETLKKNNITSVRDIIVDASFFDNNRVHPAWPADQLNQWYACEVSGINYNNNCIRITAENKNGKVVLGTEPTTSFLTFINQVRLVGSGSSALGAYRNSKPNVLIVKGNLRGTTSFDVAIEKPPAFFAWHLKECLTAQGIEVQGGLLGQYVKQVPALQILHTFETPLADVLYRSNKDSLGLAAESLIKTISAEQTEGRINGEWPHGLTLVGNYLCSLGADPNDFVLDDGSGLSRNNRLTTRIIVSVLKDLYASANWAMFESSLSVGGEDGTTSKYFQEPQYRGRILGKTGYISGVRAFSGICKTPSGDILFSILTEDGNGLTRNWINEITKSIFDRKF